MIYKTPEHIIDCIHDNSDKESMYIYDLEVMRSKMDLLACLPGNVKTFYAMKVNPHVQIVKEALKHENISWIEVASQWEMDRVIQSWQDDVSRVIYTGPSKKTSELGFSVQNNIQYLNVESIREAVRIDIEAKEKGVIQPILLRLNTKHGFKPGEAGVVLWSGATQFWVPQDSVVEDLKILSELKNLKIEGFHMYPATWVMKAEVLLRSVDLSFKFLRDLEDMTGVTYSTIDFWGGFGVNYWGFQSFDIEKYAQWLEKLIEKYSMSDKTLILELGRYIWADMWYFVTKINDIKKIGKNESWTEVTGVLCHAGTNAHKRPQVLKVNYHIDIINMYDQTQKEVEQILKELWVQNRTINPNDTLNIYGPFCTSVDYIAQWKTGFTWSVGDFVVMPQAGAYGLSMSPQDFLSHPRVEEIIIW